MAPLYSGSKVKLAFYQKPYILKDGVTYGTSLKLQGIQVVTVNGSAGVDTGDLSDAAVAELFTRRKASRRAIQMSQSRTQRRQMMTSDVVITKDPEPDSGNVGLLLICLLLLLLDTKKISQTFGMKWHVLLRTW